MEVPEGILPRDSMVSALLDIHLIEGAKVGQKIMGDTLKVHSYYQKMYDKYRVTQDEFDESFKYYSDRPKVMHNIYKEVIEQLNKIQQAPPRTPLTEDIDRGLAKKQNDSISFGKPLTQTLESSADSSKQEAE